MFEIIKLPALIIGLTQLFERAGLPTKYLPMIAVLIGALLNPALLGSWNMSTISEGAFTGLVATGLISAVDKRLKKASSIQVFQVTPDVTIDSKSEDKV